MKTIYIITGATGHLGGCIADSLLCSGETVRALLLKNEARETRNVCDILDPGHFTGMLSFVEGDMREPDSLKPLFNAEEDTQFVVIHCAGIVTIASKYDQRVWEVNVTGTKNLLEECFLHPVRKFIYVSSVHAIPVMPGEQMMHEIDRYDPEAVSGLYAKTKAAASQLVLDAAGKGLDAVVVNPSGLVGPGDYLVGHTTQLVIDYLKGRLTAMINGSYDFVDVRDVTEAIINAVEQGRKGECYILSNRIIEVPELMKILSEVSGRKPVRTILPMWFANITAPLSELYYKIRKQPPLYTAYSLETLSGNAKFSHEKATRELGYQTRDFRETLRDTVTWLKERKMV